MNQSMMGLVGSIVGSAIGILGGLIGTYFSIKNTKTPAERRFMVKMGIGIWVALLLLIGLPLVLALVGAIPKWLYWTMVAVFFILLVPTILWGNKHQAALREEKEIGNSA